MCVCENLSLEGGEKLYYLASLWDEKRKFFGLFGRSVVTVVDRLFSKGVCCYMEMRTMAISASIMPKPFVSVISSCRIR